MSFDSQNCVFYLYCNSPGKSNLSHHLQTHLQNFEYGQITYKQ